jgi:hypothetical protein
MMFLSNESSLISSHSVCNRLRSLIRYVALKISMPRGKKKGLSTKKFDRCVSKVKSRSGKKANPYAVCNASMGGKTKHRKSK